MFIVVEGLDGSGKSTLAARLVTELSLRYPSRRVVHAREPGGTPMAEYIRDGLLSDKAKRETNHLAETYLIMAARTYHSQEIAMLLENGAIVVCERWLLSTLSYQAGQNGCVGERLLDMHEGLVEPDHQFVLDVPKDVRDARIGERNFTDHLESRPVDDNFYYWLSKLEKVDSGTYTRLTATTVEDNVLAILSFLNK